MIVNFASEMKHHSNRVSQSLKSPVVTLGNFDGVHKGHLSLLEELKARAMAVNGESVVVTFEPHPGVVLGKGNIQLLTDASEKRDLLEKSGIDHLLTMDFTENFASQSACDFIGNTLVDQIGINTLLLGYDNRLGWRAEGDHSVVKDCALKHNFKVAQSQMLKLNGSTISSSAIRAHLKEGNLQSANSLLGYDYHLKGTVIGGKRIGRELGFPTANIEPRHGHKLIPGDGVYAVRVVVDGSPLTGMLNIGLRPTMEGDLGRRSIEVHIFNFNEDIYGENIGIYFAHRLRDEMKFSSLDQLVRQLVVDREESLRLFGQE